MSNRDVLRMLLHIMGVPETNVVHVQPRPGEDRKYSLNSMKIRTQLEWEPQHTNFQQGLQETIAWYASHADLWRPIKAQVEQHYAALGH